MSVGAADVADLARRLTLAEQDTERGAAPAGAAGSGSAQSSARPGRWVAAPPGVALGALLTQQRHELEKAELAAALLAEEYREAAAEPAVHDLVEVVTGTSAVAQRFLQLQLGAAEEVCALVTGNRWPCPAWRTTPRTGGRARGCATGWSWSARCWTCRTG